MTLWLAALASGSTIDGVLAEYESLRANRLVDRAPTIPEEAYRRAEAGEVVTGLQPGSPAPRAWGVAVIDVPLAAVWAAVNDNPSKPRVTQLAHLEVLDGAPCVGDRTVFQYLDIRFFTDRWWVVHQRVNPTLADGSGGRMRELSWHSVDDATAHLTPQAQTWARDGIEVPFAEGAWLLLDLGGDRTLVEYYASSDPGGAHPRQGREPLRRRWHRRHHRRDGETWPDRGRPVRAKAPERHAPPATPLRSVPRPGPFDDRARGAMLRKAPVRQLRCAPWPRPGPYSSTVKQKAPADAAPVALQVPQGRTTDRRRWRRTDP